jgi:DNA polymerase-1
MIFFDFEYRNPYQLKDLVCVAIKDTLSSANHVYDLRSLENRKTFTDYFKLKSQEIWSCYNGLADLTCLHTLGLDIKNLKFIDAMVEARMITLSHPKYEIQQGSLLHTLRKLELFTAEEFGLEFLHKENSRKLILNHENYSLEQWQIIEKYATGDVDCLPGLLKKVGDLHQEINDEYSLVDAFTRGEFVKLTVLLHYNSKGFPIDLERLEAIYNNRQSLMYSISEKVNEYYNINLYEYDKKTQKHTFKIKIFKELLENQLQVPHWKLTKAGKPCTQEEYIDEMVKSIPSLHFLHQTRKTLKAFKGTDYRDLVTPEGYIRPESKVFSQKTGRNTPLPKSGFLLNLSPWLRSALIRPKPGMAFFGIDWSQQEIGIAAILSGDDRMLQVYNSSDPYLALAVMAGAAPKTATKKSHFHVRQNFKAVQLGIGYGKGETSLALDVWINNPDLSKLEAEKKASEIFRWHKSFFHKYWEWVYKNITLAKSRGWIKSLDNWTLYCNNFTPATRLQNYPMQANAAYMLRETLRNIADTNLDLVCTLHDAVYVQCPVEQALEHKQLLKACMDKASAKVLNGFVLRTDEPHIYTHEDPYYDERSDETYGIIKNLLGDVMNHPGYLCDK